MKKSVIQERDSGRNNESGQEAQGLNWMRLTHSRILQQRQ